MKKQLALIFILLFSSVFHFTVAAQEADCEEGYHLFDHEYLATDPVCIPDNPERIIALDMAALELLLYTDHEIVGTTEWMLDELAASLPPLYETFAGITNMGYPVNTEMALEAQPDLVLAYDGGDGLIDYDSMSEIAPVVVTSLAVEDWERTTQFWSEVLGVEETFEEMKATYDARIAELQAALPEDPAETEVSLTTAMTYGLTLWMSDSPQGKILADVGFARPEAQQLNPEGDYWLSISEETLDMADGDVAFVFAYATTVQEVLEEENQVIADFLENPLWQSLNVAQNGEVYVVDGYWYRASTYLIANRIIDDLFASLTDVTPETTYTDLLPGVAGAEAEATAEATITCEEGFQAVVDATDTAVCLPIDPQRIVALSEVDIDALLALGVEPIAVTNGRGQAAPPSYLTDSLSEEIVSTGTFFQPNLEIVLEQAPDLILFAGFTDPDVLEQLNAIAPVYNAATFVESWQTHLTRLGDALNMQSEAEALIADYDARVETMREAISADEETGAEFIVVRWSAEGPQIMAPRTISSRILMDLGLVPPEEIPELQDDHAHSAPLSLETLDIVDVDWAFVGTLQNVGDAADALNETLESPLFQALDIVQNERIFVIDGSIWTSVGGYIGAMTILDDIEAALFGGE